MDTALMFMWTGPVVGREAKVVSLWPESKECFGKVAADRHCSALVLLPERPVQLRGGVRWFDPRDRRQRRSPISRRSVRPSWGIGTPTGSSTKRSGEPASPPCSAACCSRNRGPTPPTWWPACPSSKRLSRTCELQPNAAPRPSRQFADGSRAATTSSSQPRPDLDARIAHRGRTERPSGRWRTHAAPAIWRRSTIWAKAPRSVILIVIEPQVSVTRRAARCGKPVPRSPARPTCLGAVAPVTRAAVPSSRAIIGSSNSGGHSVAMASRTSRRPARHAG